MIFVKQTKTLHLHHTHLFEDAGSQKHHQHPPKNPLKTDPKPNQIFNRFVNRFFIDFSSLLEGFWAPFGRNNRLNEATLIWEGGLWRRLPAKGVQGYPKTAKITPNGTPSNAQTTPKTPKTAPNGTPWTPKCVQKLTALHTD